MLFPVYGHLSSRMCHWQYSAFFRHLDISRESRRTSKCKMTRKILTAIVQRLVNLVSLDISGHIMLDNCTVPHFEEAMGRPRWVTHWIYNNVLFRVLRNCFYIFIWTYVSALSRARAASILSRSWRGPCSFWVYMTPPFVMWHTSLRIRYWLNTHRFFWLKIVIMGITTKAT